MDMSTTGFNWSAIIASIVALTSVAFAFGQIRYQSGRNTRISDSHATEISRLQGRIIVIEKSLIANNQMLARVESRIDNIYEIMSQKRGDTNG